ncbi:hypothetical protein AUK04_04665 [Candidatus Roizmanbacteria bacterium CG2_30_33_16]|uniref:Uncharacterized protein n=1 Tax=Candidatus Roizmanbacteria bacterium CG2_30_33_16 TaxID=1805340 RepID=A0A1J5HL02_9BACT|nr:MAG: hypothetical protein AUK04_04665 [Candidatus Roizmanbacteria bacterium CG2_30_33_16]
MKILVTLFITISGLFFVPNVNAKLLPRFQGKPAAKVVVASGVVVSPRLRFDRGALVVYFGNLNKANSVTYTLMYQTSGVDQRVSGTLDSTNGNSLIRELYFGTCSSGVCRLHGDLSNMKLEVTSDLTNGKKTLKRFKIKI